MQGFLHREAARQGMLWVWISHIWSWKSVCICLSFEKFAIFLMLLFNSNTNQWRFLRVFAAQKYTRDLQFFLLSFAPNFLQFEGYSWSYFLCPNKAVFFNFIFFTFFQHLEKKFFWDPLKCNSEDLKFAFPLNEKPMHHCCCSGCCTKVNKMLKFF